MRFFERACPKQGIELAGGVTIEIAEPMSGKPMEIVTREGSIITVPFHRAVEFFLLGQRGGALLFTHDGTAKPHTQKKFWFCGFDQAPFLSEITEAAYCAFLRGGETGFFQSLKPEVVHKCEGYYGVTAKRQGDVYLCPIGGLTWKELQELCHVRSGNNLQIEEFTAEKPDKVFDTRHTFVGKVAKVELLFGHTNVWVGSGTIMAPDHAPLVLETPHIIAQSAGLVDPKGD